MRNRVFLIFQLLLSILSKITDFIGNICLCQKLIITTTSKTSFVNFIAILKTFLIQERIKW